MTDLLAVFEPFISKESDTSLLFIKQRMRYINYIIFDNLLKKITDQTSEPMTHHHVLSIRYKDYGVTTSEPLEIEKEDAEIATAIATVDNDALYLDMPLPFCVAVALSTNASRYYFVPLLFSCPAKKTSHRLTVVFDMVNKHVFLLDPNGSSNYFNHVFSYKIDGYLENLLDNWTRQIAKETGIAFEYRFQLEWIVENAAINRNFSGDIAGGNCVLITLLLCHILAITNEDLPNVFNKLALLNDAITTKLISDYYMFVADLLPVLSKEDEKIIFEIIEKEMVENI